MSYKRHGNQPPPPSQPAYPVYQSGMSAQQKYLQIVDSVKSQINLNNNDRSKKMKGCSMHPQPSKKCRKCKQIIDAAQHYQQTNEQENVLNNISRQTPSVLRLNTENPWQSFSQKLLSCIQSAQANHHAQSQQAKTVKQLVHKIPNQEISIQCYIKGNTEIPTQFIQLFYRLVKMRPTYEQIKIMLRHNNINVKVMGMLYIRIYAHYQDIYGWLKDKLEDYELINANMIISQFAKRLLDQDKLNYDGLRLPRLPIKIQKFINSQIGKSNINADAIRKQQMHNKKQQQAKLAQLERTKKLQEQKKKQKQAQRQVSIQRKGNKNKNKRKNGNKNKNRSISNSISSSSGKSRERSRKKYKNQKSNKDSNKKQKQRKRLKSSSQSNSFSSSSSSFSSSSSSSSSSQSYENSEKNINYKSNAKLVQSLQQKEKEQKVQLNVGQRKQKPKQNLSLQDLRAKIKGINPQNNNEQITKIKRQQILQRYGDMDELANKQHKLFDQQEQNNYSESNSQQKYEMG